ncbi:hypothetical protein M136_4866, partial [Bacteroides fragilis str. S36L11]
MKNSSVSKQIKLQELEIQYSKRKKEINQDCNHENWLVINPENMKANNQVSNIAINIVTKGENNAFFNPSFNQGDNQTFGSFISFAPSGINNAPNYISENLP